MCNGARISYVDVGDGPLVLLLHGLGHSTHGWRKVMGPIAAAGYRVMAVDLPGFGYSDKPGGYTLEGYVDFIRAWLDLHCVERATLVGNSMGGAIAAAVAGMAPERVGALVLVDPGGFGREVTWMLRLAGLRVVRGLIGVRFTPRRVRHALRVVFHDASQIDDEDVQRIVELSELPGARESVLEISHSAIGLRGLRPGLGLGEIPQGISSPTLVLWGDKDRVIPVSHAQLAREAIAGAEVTILERCGHCPQLETPDRFTRVVLPFLHRHWAPDQPEGGRAT